METWRHGDMETWRHGDMEKISKKKGRVTLLDDNKGVKSAFDFCGSL